MYPNQQPPVYTTRHYNYNPQANAAYSNGPPSYNGPRPPVQSYPYHSNYQQPPTTVTYVSDRPSYGQQPSYAPPDSSRSSSINPQMRSNGVGPTGGGILKSNMVSNGNTFYQPARPHEPLNSSRTTTQHTANRETDNKSLNLSDQSPFFSTYGGYHYPSQIDPAKRITTQNTANREGENKSLNLSDENPFFSTYGGYHYPSQVDPAKRITTQNTANREGDNKSLNLSDESPFFSTYGGYYYPSQIDPAKRITTQNTANREGENKSLNLSDENPFFSTYGHYHYPSQIDPQKRITEMPKATAPLAPTNETSYQNPLNSYRAPPVANYPSGGGYGPNSFSTPTNDWNRNNPPPPVSYRPAPTYHDQPSYSSGRSASPPHSQRAPSPPVHVQSKKANPPAPPDKSSMNMSADNPFAASYGQHHYPSQEEIKAQKRANENNARLAEQRPVNGNRPAPSSNQMSEYPEAENKDVIAGKGNSKYTRFDVTF